MGNDCKEKYYKKINRHGHLSDGNYFILYFYGGKIGSTIPILDYYKAKGAIDATQYANPLTQILMLTAIVVGVATVGLGLTLARKIYDEYSTFNEDEILDQVKEEK